MAETLKGMRVAIPATDRFEESERLQPKKAREQAGAQPEVGAAPPRNRPGALPGPFPPPDGSGAG